MGINTYYDLLRTISPSAISIVASSTVWPICMAMNRRYSCGGVSSHSPPRVRGRKRRLQALFTDGSGTIEVVWFNRVASIQKTYNTNTQYILFGKPSMFNNHLNIVHPEVDPLTVENETQGLTGVYNLTEVLRNRSFTSRAIHKLIVGLLNTPAVQHVADTLPPELINRFHLMPAGRGSPQHPSAQ